MARVMGRTPPNLLFHRPSATSSWQGRQRLQMIWFATSCQNADSLFSSGGSFETTRLTVTGVAVPHNLEPLIKYDTGINLCYVFPNRQDGVIVTETYI